MTSSPRADIYRAIRREWPSYPAKWAFSDARHEVALRAIEFQGTVCFEWEEDCDAAWAIFQLDERIRRTILSQWERGELGIYTVTLHRPPYCDKCSCRHPCLPREDWPTEESISGVIVADTDTMYARSVERDLAGSAGCFRHTDSAAARGG